ncbi:MAG: hypothetical protein AAGC55_26810, partial [Myxococcota bacterium]
IPLLSRKVLEVVASWKARGHDVVVVTAAMNGASARVKYERFRDEFGFLGKDALVMTAKKHLVRGDLLIDDKPRNLLSYRRAWPDAELATIAWPYQDREELRRARVAVCGQWDRPDEAWAALDRHVAALEHAR